MITISLCMIVKNEEQTLPRCLTSAQGLADEVIVVDTGSTDGTVAAAEALDDNGSEHSSPEAELLAAGLLRLHAERMQIMGRERRTRDRFVSVYPDVPIVEVAALPGDVHDLDGLRAIGERLSGAA